jgi:hypothetical protein
MNLTDPILSMAYKPRWGVASKKALRWASISLLVIVCASILLFSFYVLVFYCSAILKSKPAAWNEAMPGLYERGEVASICIGLHFISGALILLMGSVQVIWPLRYRFPLTHRWIGHIYILSSLLTAAGGLFFIALKGTIGGVVMDVGLSIYGMLLFISAFETYRYAIKGRLADHRVWALRLYALVIGAWLYRMYYGLWLSLADGAGHTEGFNGVFDHVMVFFFYLPNLLVVEIFIRARRMDVHPALRLTACVPLLAASFFLVLGTYYFTVHCWGPAILESFTLE